MWFQDFLSISASVPLRNWSAFAIFSVLWIQARKQLGDNVEAELKETVSLRYSVLGFLLLWLDTMVTAALTKESI